MTDISRARLASALDSAIDRLSLDLRGLTVVTEAATGVFATTAVIAAKAGASVRALARDSHFGAVQDCIDAVRGLIAYCAPSARIEFHDRNTVRDLYDVDIVTNLGHVRPIDRTMLSACDPGRLVVSSMCERWEFRPGDLDLACCRELNIRVAGTNESDPRVDCFASSGAIVVRLLHERSFEVRRGRFVVASPDQFGAAITDCLMAAGAEVIRTPTLVALGQFDWLRCDAIVLADYTSTEPLLGADGVPPDEIVRRNPAIEVVRLAGPVDEAACARAGLVLYPDGHLEPRRMTRTLAYAGIRPMVDLHAAGLKVGELLVRGDHMDPLVQLF